MKHKILPAVVTSITLAAAGLAVANPAMAATRVIGGSPAPETPWAVQLVFEQDGGSYGCSGEQINKEWVLTARHCVDGDTSIDVYHSNSTTDRGPASEADDWSYSPDGDVGLIHLSTPKSLDSYPSLNLQYSAKESGSGKIMGYGLRADGEQADQLYEADVNLIGDSTDAYEGDAQHISGDTGASNHGDSGGPLIVAGNIVGVCSTGDEADPGSDTHAGSNYAILAGSADWISQTAGV